MGTNISITIRVRQWAKLFELVPSLSVGTLEFSQSISDIKQLHIDRLEET